MVQLDYEVIDLSEEELAREREVYGGLAQSVRELSLASLRTTVDEDEAIAIRAEIEAITERLMSSVREREHLGIRVRKDGLVLSDGNAVIGTRNPVAPPLQIETTDRGARSEFRLNALYEGPPGCVHGGVIALVMDQICGEAAISQGHPGMTGTLTIRYARPTRLGDCAAEAWVEEVDGVKTIVHGVLRDAKGRETATAEGVFIMPRWAREAMADTALTPPRFD